MIWDDEQEPEPPYEQRSYEPRQWELFVLWFLMAMTTTAGWLVLAMWWTS